jgi:hypothetical protein
MIYYKMCSHVPERPETVRGLPRGLGASRRLDGLWLRVYTAGVLFVVLTVSGTIDRLLEFMPSGSYSIMRTLFATAGVLGVFFLGFSLGGKRLSLFSRIAFYILFALHLLALGTSILLSTIIPPLVAFAAGYTLGSGRLPIRFIIAVAVIVNVLHVGKYPMRERYWPQFGGSRVDLTPIEYPAYYRAWVGHGLDSMFEPKGFYGEEDDDSIFTRASLIQMVLYAQRRAPEHIPYLMGETIWIIPKLFIPRVIWSQKPRTHEGQVILNTRFGRQTYDQAQETYISWGMLAEFYANFGYLGGLVLGLLLGLLMGKVTQASISVPTGTLRFLVSLVFLVKSFDATGVSAAVWATSMFQALVIVLLFGALVMRRREMEDFDQEMEELEEEAEPTSEGTLAWQS